MSYKTKTITFLILTIWLQACAAPKNFRSGVNTIMDRITIVPAAVAQFVTDVSKNIYSNDSLKDRTPVMIKTFNVTFYNQKDSFQLQFNDMSFYFSGDSVYYNNFIFPKWDVNKYADTMRSIFDCSYQIPNKNKNQCISGEYAIKKGKIEKIADYKPCMQ